MAIAASTRILRAAIAILLLLANATRGLSDGVPPSAAKHPAAPNLAVESEVKANALADKLLRLDQAAMREFERRRPGTLPELKLSLPKVNAAQFDWCNLNKVCEPRRQLTGDCWANAATEALECNYLIRNNRRATLSVQPLLDTLKLGANDKNMGGAPATALNFFLKIGTASIQSYPYTGEPSTPRYAVALSRRGLGIRAGRWPSTDYRTAQRSAAPPWSARDLRLGYAGIQRLPRRIV